MYELSIQRIFSARHAITIKGVAETPHNHHWELRVELQGNTLDEDGLLLDFHELERMIDDIIRPFMDADFNETPPFNTINPTAENIAQHIGKSLLHTLHHYADNQLSLKAVRLTESPHCIASFLPNP